MSEFKPELWSDFDGTAVEKVPRINWRNWTKYPLHIIDGYIDFLNGVQLGGVKTAGIVSRRPDILPRRFVTALSIARLGLDEYFSGEHQVVLAGSEDNKAQFVANRAREGIVGMLDDQPHKIGAALIRAMSANSSSTTPITRHEVLLGAVHHSKTSEYMERLADAAVAIGGVNLYGGYGDMSIEGAGFNIHVVTLEPYGLIAGRAFAAQLTDLNQ